MGRTDAAPLRAEAFSTGRVSWQCFFFWFYRVCGIFFLVSKWSRDDRMSGPFVCSRLLLAALVLCALIGCLVDAGHQPIWSAAAVSLPGAVPRASLRHWPVYLTNLGLLGLAVHLALSAAVVVERLVHHHHHGLCNLSFPKKKQQKQKKALGGRRLNGRGQLIGGWCVMTSFLRRPLVSACRTKVIGR